MTVKLYYVFVEKLSSFVFVYCVVLAFFLSVGVTSFILLALVLVA